MVNSRLYGCRASSSCDGGGTGSGGGTRIGR